MANTIEGIFMSKSVTSLQIKVHECHVKSLKPRESLLTIDEESERSDSSDSSDEYDGQGAATGDCITRIEDITISDIVEVVTEEKE